VVSSPLPAPIPSSLSPVPRVLSLFLDSSCSSLVHFPLPREGDRAYRIPDSAYCIVLLSALFASSCYWAPTDLPPISEFFSFNRTTELSSQPRQEDRCWCDINNGNIFDPFPPFESATVHVEGEGEVEHEPGYIPSLEEAPTATYSQESWTRYLSEENLTKLARTARGRSYKIGRAVVDWFNGVEYLDTKPPPVEWKEEENVEEAAVKPEKKDGGEPWLRRRYDLRENGVGVILDFGWGRSKDEDR